MFSPRGKHFGKNKLPEMMELFKIAKPLFDVNLISFDSGLNKFAKRRKTRIIWVKLAASYLIFGAVCLNGLYSILFTKSGIVETSFILLVILVFFLAMIIFSPMLIRPGPFVSLLNGRQAFILENIRANFLNPPTNLVAKWKFISELSHILSYGVRIAVPGVLVLLMFLETGLNWIVHCARQRWARVSHGGAGVGNFLPGWAHDLLYVHGPLRLAALCG
ncbi:Protein translocase subunit SecDF [Folsomia candida]|uniref:Protein translocase subunit SecDF n=1 Tax=Folsomia candida TaxID=158441 RepID=A0A226D927_FOLCA|nr:Protein translocase subunit SecDF [Folsomia candida]